MSSGCFLLECHRRSLGNPHVDSGMGLWISGKQFLGREIRIKRNRIGTKNGKSLCVSAWKSFCDKLGFFLWQSIISFHIKKIIWNRIPSGLVNSLKVGREMTVCETEWTGSSTQVISLGWQDFIQRMMSERSSLGLLNRRRNCLILCDNATAEVLMCRSYRLNWWSNEQQWSTLQDNSPHILILNREVKCPLKKYNLTKYSGHS